MNLLIVYFIVLAIMIVYIFYNSKENFDGTTSSQMESPTTSGLNPTTSGIIPTTSGIIPTTSGIIPTSSASYEDMEIIDFSVIDKLEQNKRDKQSQKLNECVSSFANKQVKPLRDVGEMMYRKDGDADVIFDYTSYGEGTYLDQMGYW
jgi:hypothetical protein